MITLVIGLPGTGKTTIASILASEENAIILDGDVVRSDISKDLGFSPEDRVEQARRIGAMARLLDAQGFSVFCSFICPTEATRQAFGERDLTVWMNRLSNRQYDDSTRMWEIPNVDVIIEDGATISETVALIKKKLAEL